MKDKIRNKVKHETSVFVNFEYLIEHNEYQTDKNCSDKVKGILRSRLQFWEEIGTHDNILNIIKNGHKIPFYSFHQDVFRKKFIFTAC